MSDLNVAIRQLERIQEYQNYHRQQLVRDVARRNGRLGPLERLADFLRYLINPRGTALAQYRRAKLAQDTTGTMIFLLATPPAETLVRFVPTVDQLPGWRDAA